MRKSEIAFSLLCTATVVLHTRGGDRDDTVLGSDQLIIEGKNKKGLVSPLVTPAGHCIFYSTNKLTCISPVRSALLSLDFDLQ